MARRIPSCHPVFNIYRLQRCRAKCLREISGERYSLRRKGKGETCETSRRIECTKQVGSTWSIFVPVSYVLSFVSQNGDAAADFACLLLVYLSGCSVRVTRWNATLYRVCCSLSIKCLLLSTFVTDKMILLDKEWNNYFNNFLTRILVM